MQQYIAVGGKQYSEVDLQRAMQETGRQLADLQVKMEATLLDMPALIFTAQILMLKDKGFTDSLFSLVKGGMNPPQAVVEVGRDYVSKFSRKTRICARKFMMLRTWCGVFWRT